VTPPVNTELRDLYDLQVRRNTTLDGSGSLVDSSPDFVRWRANEGLGWSEISWTQLSDANASDVIAAQIDFFAAHHQSFVWRVHDYDQPTDLGARLLEAGFTQGGNSAVLVAPARSFATPSVLPEGTEMVEVSDETDVDRLIATHEEVFGHSHQDLRRSILARMKNAPLETAMYVVTADGSPISAARVEFLPNREFATLWGGGTLEQWRGRGVYRALVYERARLATARGYSYLLVLSSEQSHPILRRLGFVNIAAVTTYSWAPANNTR
jgi:GNAT superfamily N-acetyltransferase